MTESHLLGARSGAGGTTRVVRLGRAANLEDAVTAAVAGPADGPSSANGAPARDPLAAAQAYRLHGSELWSSGDIPGAVGRWERALEVLDEDRHRVPPERLQDLETVVRLNAAQGLLQLGRFAEARCHAEVVLQLRPGCAKARYRLAESCGGLGEWVSAEEALAALEAQGCSAAAAKGRAGLRERRRAAREVDRALAARMLGCGASGGCGGGADDVGGATSPGTMPGCSGSGAGAAEAATVAAAAVAAARCHEADRSAEVEGGREALGGGRGRLRQEAKAAEAAREGRAAAANGECSTDSSGLLDLMD